jgi:hypothetical protein
MSRDHRLGSITQPQKPLGPALPRVGEQIKLKDYPHWPPYTVTAVRGGEVHFRRGATRWIAPIDAVISA